MNKRSFGWLLVVITLALLGPACLGDGSPDRKSAEPGAAEVGAGGMRGTDAGDLDPGDEMSMSVPMSEQAGPRGGATGSYKTCSDMYFTCQEKGGFCTKKYPGCDTWGQSACGTCYENCQAGSRYPVACKCGSCGFTE